MGKERTSKMIAMVLAGGIALFGVGSSAGAVPVSSYGSNATINFTTPSDAPDVLDPTELAPPFVPGEGDPSGDGVTGDVGPLTLDFVSSLNFGSNPISASEQVYNSTILRPFIQVTDRRGTGAGWHVTAQLGEFTDGDATASLNGATLTLSNGEAVSPGATAAPTPADPVSLPAGGAAAAVVNAPVDTGLGTWVNRWYPDEGSEGNNNVTLTVPAGAATAGDHTAVITWTLMDTPQ